MRRHERSQRVNIDEYFDGFEDLAEPVATQATWQPAPALASHPFKAMLAAKPGYIPPVLAPYQPHGRVLSSVKPLSSLELESAHRAVASIKNQLLGDPDPSVHTQVFHPGPAGAISLNSTEPQADQPPLAATPGSARLWWGSLAAIVGTTATALLVYAHGNNYLSPALSQAQTLGRQSLHQVLNLGQQPVAEAPGEVPPAAAEGQRTVEQAAMAQSMRLAYTAAELTQSALTPEDWQQVVLFWRRAIDELQPIPADHALAAQAQDRREVYEDNLAYAQGELEMAPFRMAVKAAESASDMASSARTPDDWAEVASKWQEALGHMEAVSEQNPRYGTAQTKRAEYATKFAYSQNRYLTLEARASR